MSDKESVTGPQKRARRTMRMSNNYDEMFHNPTAEEKLREENPGLQELWDQYQTMLKLLTPPKMVLARATRPKKRLSIDDIRSAFTKGRPNE